MLKKISITLLLFFSIFIQTTTILAGPPPVHCIGLPGCGDDTLGESLPPSNYDKPSGLVSTGISNFVSETIQYVAVIAVLSLMFAGLMYLLSGGEEEKLNKAKKMVIWSLVGVFLSISAWMIINIINEMSLNI